MSLAIEKLLTPVVGHPAKQTVEQQGRLNIAVVFTSVESTLAALREAGTLAQSLGAQITLLVPQVVPYPLPLESPPVLVDFSEKRFHVIASQSPVETKFPFIYVGTRWKLSEAYCDRVRSSSLEDGSDGGRQRKLVWPTSCEKLVTKSCSRKRSRRTCSICFMSRLDACFYLLAGPSPGPATSCRRKLSWTTSLPESRRWGCLFT